MGDHLQQPDEERSGEDNTSGKRKLENTIELAKQKAQEIAARLVSDAAADPKRQRVGGSDASSDPSPWSDSAPPAAAPSYPVSYNTQSSQYGALNSKKIAIPNGKVGVVIGKGGETIKYIQLQSGAKIQITKDQEADPHALTRDVDLSGTQDQMSRAEQLINDVISEAEAGAYSSSGGQGSNIKQSGGEQFSMKVPNDRVGLLIGKGGETIKYMQNTSGARVQIIPLHLPAGDPTTERTVYINGSAEQIEAAKELINEVVNGKRIMNSSGSNAYQQPAYQAPPAYWASGGQQPPMQQQASYGGYQQQPGSHPTPPSYYGNYATQQPAWDQSNASAQPQQQTAGYGYYGQQAQMGAAAPVNPNYGYAQAPGAGSNAYNQGYGQQPPSSYGQGQAPTPEQQKAYAGSGYGQTQPEGTAAVSSQPTTQEASAYNQAAYNNPYWNSSGYPSQAAQAGYDQTGYPQGAPTSYAAQPAYGQGGYAAQPAYGQGAYSGDYGQQPHQEAQPQAANGDSESAGYEVKTNKENAGDGSSNGVKGNGTSES